MSLQDKISGHNADSNIHKPKAKIHTWLAWQQEPGKPFGQSITNKVLSTENETCEKFVKWLKELFSA